MVEKVERDRLNAYVDPFTTSVIEDIKTQHYNDFGIKLTIGQAVDLIAKYYVNNQK